MRKAWRSVENKETHKWRLLLWFASCLIIWVDIGQPHPHQAPPNTMWGKHQTPCLAAKTPNIMSDSENTKHHVWQTLNNSEKYAESSDEKTFVSSNVWLLTFKILWRSPEAQLKDADKRRGENESQQKGNFLNHRLVPKCLIFGISTLDEWCKLSFSEKHGHGGNL